MASILSSLLLAAPPAHAGSYVLSCTGGVAITAGIGSIPYHLNGNTYGGKGGGIDNPSCSGSIHPTLTWQPAQNQTLQTDPPPPAGSVIIAETCTATGLAVTSPSGTAQAQCDDGFGLSTSQASATGTPVYNTATPPQVVYVGCNPSVTETRYTTNGGQTISLPAIDASASASVSPYEQASASVSYTVNAYPVTVSLGGATIYNGSPEALTGQQITATVNAPYPIDPNSYHWDVSGSMFKNYDWTLASNQKSELSDTDYFQPAFTFYDATAELLHIKSNVTVVCPDGTRLMVNPDAYLNMQKPTETKWAISSTGPTDGGFYNDYSAGQYAPQYGAQVTWNPITMTVPSPFLGGQVCLVQYASFNRVATRVALQGASNTYVVTPATQGLDTGFPYFIAYQLDNSGNIIVGGDGKYSTLSPPQWNISGSGPTQGAGGDQPSIPCEPGLMNGDPGGSDWRSSTASDQFDTWTMYRPPAVGNYPTVWVPVQTIHWGWSGSAKDTDANGNVVFDSSHNPQWFFTTPQVSPAGSPSNTPLFPTWNTIIPFGLTMGPPALH